jgi:hypothetical protein
MNPSSKNMSTTSNPSSSNALDSAMKHLLFRAGLTGAGFVLYSTLVLGNGINTSVLTNAAAASAAAVGAETTVKYIAPHVIAYKAQGINGGLPMLAEAGLTGLYYSQIFPRIFPEAGRSTSMQELVTIGAAMDASAQIVGPKISAMLAGEQVY